MTFEDLKAHKSTTLALRMAADNGHDMKHDRDAGLDRDMRSSWKCSRAACSARLTAIAQTPLGKPTEVEVSGTALGWKCLVAP